MSAHPGIDPLLQQALEWQVTLWSGEVSHAEQAEFEAWLARDPAHRDAWRKAQRLHARLAGLPDDVSGQLLRHAPSRQGRRRLLTALVWLAGGGLLAQAARDTPQWQWIAADHATHTGERRQIVLDDGTRIDLNSASAVDVHYDSTFRRVLLRRGEILITTAVDTTPARWPFLVATAQGDIQALGTRFRVQRTDEHIRVAVFEGAVLIRPTAAGQARLNAGQQARFDAHHIVSEGESDASAIAWTRGQLVASHVRLADFIEQLGHHRPGILRCDPQVADWPISGVFPLDDTDRVLAALSEALPVRIRMVTPYWVAVGPR